MPSLKGIKSRINSVKNTSKITNAMKLVSAAKFARASNAVNSARPYAMAFEELVMRAAVSASDDHPFLAERQVGNILLVIMSTDRGLCGGLNSNLFKAAFPKIEAWRKEGKNVQVMALGRKANDFCKKIKIAPLLVKDRITDKPNIVGAKEIAKTMAFEFLEHKVDEVYLVYPKFVSALAQEPQFQRVLPVLRPTHTTLEVVNTIFEPEAEKILVGLLERRINVQVFQALLETTASEHGSRMSAMDSATRNAKEVTKKLTVQYNRARQASITKELIEITSGASALN
jgi:F-type H+-transporting ATPase subunit gamma